MEDLCDEREAGHDEAREEQEEGALEVLDAQDQPVVLRLKIFRSALCL